jgi:hypothetical protein
MKNTIPDVLYRRCSHYPYGKVSGYTCSLCIGNWAKTADLKEIEELAEYFSLKGQPIAAERLRDELKKKKVFTP